MKAAARAANAAAKGRALKKQKAKKRAELEATIQLELRKVEENRQNLLVGSLRASASSAHPRKRNARRGSLSNERFQRLRSLQQALLAGEVDVASRMYSVKIADWIPGVVAAGGILSAEINGAALGVREAARHV